MSEVRDVLEHLSIQIMSENRRQKDGGLEFTAQCPYHFDGTQQEHSGSWSINAETGKHVCYACDFKGSLEYLIEKVGGVDEAEAKKLADKGARALKRVRTKDPWNGERPVSIPPMNEARIQSYDDPPDWALEARRITREAAERFTLKWDSKQNSWVIPIRDPKTCKAFGFQLKGQGHDQFKNLPAGVAKSTTLFGIEHFTGGTVIVVESPLDAVLLWCLGFQAVAIMGRTISHDQWQLLVGRADTVILALDNDDAGTKEMMKVVGRKKRKIGDKVSWVRVPYLTDYSRRIPILLYNYEGSGKDPGEQTDRDITLSVRHAQSPVARFVGAA